jgi:hypothetical protein
MIVKNTGSVPELPELPPMLRIAWSRLCLMLLVPIFMANVLDATETSILKFGDEFQVEIVDNRLTQDDAKRAFAYAKNYLYGLKKSYWAAGKAFDDIGRYYGRELADDCLLWRVKSTFARNYSCDAAMMDLLYQIVTMYPDGDVYGSQQFPDALREFIKNYGYHRISDSDRRLGGPLGGVFVLYEMLKTHPLVGSAELNAVKAEIVDFLCSDRGQGFMLDCVERRRLFLRMGPYRDAHERRAMQGEWETYIQPTVKGYLIGDLGALLTEEMGFNDALFKAMAERSYKEILLYTDGSYEWDNDECCYAFRVEYTRFPGMCSKSNPSELIYGDATPPVLREILKAQK